MKNPTCKNCTHSKCIKSLSGKKIYRCKLRDNARILNPYERCDDRKDR